jgi:hypothetical protein
MPEPPVHWPSVEQGGGRVFQSEGRIKLVRPATRSSTYANAEVGDPTLELSRRRPLLMELRARFSHPVGSMAGTAGFGFWNASLSPGQVRPRLPKAAWYFFSAPPHDVPLAAGVPGAGAKAGVLDASRPAFFALAPFALPGFVAMRVPELYRRLWPFAQWAIGVSEAHLASVDVTDWHHYSLVWRHGQARFAVDGVTVLSTPRSPAGPLAFVAWIDNAYAIADPRGRFALGTVDAPEEQWLEIEHLRIQHAHSRDTRPADGR